MKVRLATALVLTSALFAAGPVRAEVFPDFTVDSSAYGGKVFTADKITGGYTEVITFTSATDFSVSLLVNFGQFFANDGTTNVLGTGINNTYQLYATFLGSGTYSTSGTTTTFALNPNGALAVLLDSDLTTTFSTPGSGSSPWGVSENGGVADILIATGLSVTGNGNVTCTGSNNCGSFGQTTSFSLTSPAGTSFFTDPDPFFNIAITTGQFNGFPVGNGITNTLQGSADTVFNVPVPEPMSVALVGVGLFCLGAFTRRKA